MTTQLFGVKPYAPGILLVTTLVLSVAALIATLVPARKGRGFWSRSARCGRNNRSAPILAIVKC